MFRIIVIYPGEIWGGEDVLGMTIAERGPPTAVLGYPSEVQGGWSGSRSLLVMFNTKPGVASRRQTGDLGRTVGNDHTVPEIFGDENPIVATASLFPRNLPERDIRAKHEIYFRLVYDLGVCRCA